MARGPRSSARPAHNADPGAWKSVQTPARVGAQVRMSAEHVLVLPVKRTRCTHQAIALLVQPRCGGCRVAFYDGVIKAQPLSLIYPQFLCIQRRGFLVLTATRSASASAVKTLVALQSLKATAHSGCGAPIVAVTGACKSATRAVLLLLLHAGESKVGRIHRDTNYSAPCGQE